VSRTTQGEREQLTRQPRARQDARRQVRRVSPDRYQAGARRTSAQPLAASWRPDLDEEERPSRRSRPRGLRGLIATYGWRVYALPVLVVVTALVVLNPIGGGDAANPDSPSDQAKGGTGADVGADISEVPTKPVDLNIPTADLPNGGTFTQTGTGEWTVLPGRTDRIGTAGEFYTYTIEVEDGIDPTPYGGNDAFASVVDYTLSEPRGWVASGQVSLQRVDGDEEPDIRISLATPDTVHSGDNCGFSIQYESSCWRNDQNRVYLNLARWVRGALAFGGDIVSYRQYAINHEIGHAFKKGHVGCAEEGGLAPVMMQQTFGVANNYVAQLNDGAGNSDPVQADGKTCKPNPWPNPQAQTGG